MFTDVELLEMLANEVKTLRAHNSGEYEFTGLCKTITILRNRDLFTTIEADRALRILYDERPKDAPEEGFWWPRGYRETRLSFLYKLIKKYENINKPSKGS